MSGLFGEAPGETSQEFAERIAALYKQLNRPGAARFQAALRRRGIDVPDSFVKGIAAEQSSRQLFAPPPRFTGRVTAQRIDERWVADVVDLQSKAREEDAPGYILIVQDIFSRFLFAKTFRNKMQVESIFLRIMEETTRKPVELNTDKGTEFTSASFREMLSREGIFHRVKEGPQDLATLDRAIGELRTVLSRRTTDGKPWHEELDAAIEGMNESNHSALYMRAPDEVADDEELRFELRYKNAQMRQKNVELSKTRAENLQRQGAFRTLLGSGFRRRAGQQNWSERIHTVQSARSGYVEDTEGNTFLMSTVKPIPAATVPVQVPDFAKGGSSKVDERRRTKLRGFLPQLVALVGRAGRRGLILPQAGRDMATVPGFREALREQRATILQFVQLWPEVIRIEKVGVQNVLFAIKPEPPPAPRVERKRWAANALVVREEPQAAPLDLEEPQAAPPDTRVKRKRWAANALVVRE